MKRIFDLFTSSAKIGVLRTLCFQSCPIPLRHVASFSDQHVFSVQKALRSLVADGMVIMTERDNNVLFEMDKKNARYDLLRQFFILEAHSRIREEAERYSAKAVRALKLANGAAVLLKQARRGNAAWN